MLARVASESVGIAIDPFTRCVAGIHLRLHTRVGTTDNASINEPHTEGKTQIRPSASRARASLGL